MALTSRQWLLRKRPEGLFRLDDVELVEGDQATRALRQGEIRVRNLLILFAPTTRNWMEAPGNSLYPSIPLDTPVRALAASRVVESQDSRYPVGSRIVGMSCWSEYDILDPSQSPPQHIPEGLTAIEVVGMAGLNSLTAYFGLLRVGQPRAGETLVVSAAAGSTGSVAAQLGRVKGCRVIGIAGGAQKCAWLVESCRLDAAIDYQTEDVSAALKAHCPDGIDIYYDNVGGTILEAAVENMARFGRIVLCGQIAGYNDGQPAPHLNMMRLIYGSIRMQGFLCSDYRSEMPAATSELISLVRSGEIVSRQDIRSGFENVPRHFNALFDGGNQGTLLGLIDDDAYSAA
ncbi:NADP-dependent oxidoreductase [Novosphingobium sp.]|uniref:NADP-dependent oxidoreductase n=1 Tax=Novosphingobium sp. TaxID=1874826 RepID=UPI002FD8F29C